MSDHDPEDTVDTVRPDLAAYALHALTEPERTRVAAHLAGCPECSAELAELEEGAATLAYAVAPLDAPPGARAALMRRIDRDRAATGAAGAGTPWWASRRLAWGVSGALAAALVAVVGGAAIVATRLDTRINSLSSRLDSEAGGMAQVSDEVRQMHDDMEGMGAAVAGALDQAQQVSALQQAADALDQKIRDQQWLQYVTSAGLWSNTSWLTADDVNQPRQAVLVARNGGDRAVLTVYGLSPLPPGLVYQLWLTRHDSGAMIPGQTFLVDGSGYALVEMLLPGDATEYAGASITVEPEGGSAAPTGAPVMKASAR